MNERLAGFKVYLPQLECDPGQFKGGVKRYHLHKNEDSAALVLGSAVVYNKTRESHPVFSSKPTPSRDSISLSKKLQPNFSPLPLNIPDVSKSRTPIKHSYNNPNYNSYLELMSHPAFRQPKYTKLNPKRNKSNPIVGYAENYRSQENSYIENRGIMAQNGSRILGINDKFNCMY